LIELVEKILEKNIEKAYKILKLHGINRSEIELLVNERLYKSKE
jgi:hypothetical protein